MGVSDKGDTVGGGLGTTALEHLSGVLSSQGLDITKYKLKTYLKCVQIMSHD